MYKVKDPLVFFSALRHDLAEEGGQTCGVQRIGERKATADPSKLRFLMDDKLVRDVYEFKMRCPCALNMSADGGYQGREASKNDCRSFGAVPLLRMTTSGISLKQLQP